MRRNHRSPKPQCQILFLLSLVLLPVVAVSLCPARCWCVCVCVSVQERLGIAWILAVILITENNMKSFWLAHFVRNVVWFSFFSQFFLLSTYFLLLFFRNRTDWEWDSPGSFRSPPAKSGVCVYAFIVCLFILSPFFSSLILSFCTKTCERNACRNHLTHRFSFVFFCSCVSFFSLWTPTCEWSIGPNVTNVIRYSEGGDAGWTWRTDVNHIWERGETNTQMREQDPYGTTTS